MKKNLTGLSDAELVSFAKENNRDALDELYDRHAPMVYRKCIALLRNKESAQDITHDVFIKAFLNIAKLKDGQSFAKWIITITYNKCMDSLRLTKKSFTNSLDEQYDNLASDDDEKNIKIEKEAELEHLEQAFLKLPEPDRVLLLMQFQDNLSIQQIQEILGLKASAVKMRLKRAKEKLSKIYGDINSQ